VCSTVWRINATNGSFARVPSDDAMPWVAAVITVTVGLLPAPMVPQGKLADTTSRLALVE